VQRLRRPSSVATTRRQVFKNLVPTTSPVIAHIGALDLASYGDQLYPVVAAHELGRRLEGVQVVPFGPVGSSGPAGASSWALGHWSEHRAAALAARATLMLCGGGEIVQGNGSIYGPFYGLAPRDAADLAIDRWFLEVLGAAERECPVVWHAPGVPSEFDPATADRVRRALVQRALVAVRDERSRRLLEAAGVERDIAVVPDSALLLPRVLPAAELDLWRKRLQADGQFPPDGLGPVIVVQGNYAMNGLAPALAAALNEIAPGAHIATVAVSPCHNDHMFAATLANHAGSRVWSLPENAPLEAVAAAIAGAHCFLGVSLHGAITALAYGRPFVTLDPFEQAKVGGFAELIGWPEARTSDVPEAVRRARRRAAGDEAPPAVLRELQARIDAHFDRVAELVVAQPQRTLQPLTWRDTPVPLHLRLRRVPRPAHPAPAADPPGLRRPDVEADAAELRATLVEATAARLALREEQLADAGELERLVREASDLRGALAHLEGMVRHAERKVAEHDEARHTSDAALDRATTAARRNADIVKAARNSRTFRFTGFPRVLRNAPELDT
jgi:polysaccharide pyruvyl transferase WcaK-like protein